MLEIPQPSTTHHDDGMCRRDLTSCLRGLDSAALSVTEGVGGTADISATTGGPSRDGA